MYKIWKFICVVLFLAGFSSTGVALDQVRLSTFPSYGKNAGLLWALESGLFSQNNIDFKLIDTYQDTSIMTGAGHADVAQILCSSVGLLAQRGADYQVIAVRDQRNPIATVSLPIAKISKPADFANKRWGYTASFSPEQHLIARMGGQFGFDSGSIRKVNLDFSARVPALLRGDVDFISAWYGSALPPIANAIRKAGHEPRVMRWDDLGIDIYGECFIAKKSYIETNSELLRRWLSATESGFSHVLRAPVDGLQALRKRYGDTIGNDALVLETINQANELLKGKPNGSMLIVTKTKLANTLQWLGVNYQGDVSALIWNR